MKKTVFISFLFFICVCVWGQAEEVLWKRFYSDMTEKECQDIIGKTLTSCMVQGNGNIYGKKIDTETRNPYLQLNLTSNGDYWFIVAGPYYTSIIYMLKSGYEPNDKSFKPYLEYLFSVNDPKYAAIDMSKYFKKQ